MLKKIYFGRLGKREIQKAKTLLEKVAPALMEYIRDDKDYPELLAFYFLIRKRIHDKFGSDYLSEPVYIILSNEDSCDILIYERMKLVKGIYGCDWFSEINVSGKGVVIPSLWVELHDPDGEIQGLYYWISSPIL